MTDYEKALAGLTDYDRALQQVDTGGMSNYEKALAESKPQAKAEPSGSNYSDYTDVYTDAGLDRPFLNLRQVIGQDKTDVATAQKEVAGIKLNQVLNDAALEESMVDPLMMAPTMSAKLLGTPMVAGAMGGANLSMKALGLASDGAGAILSPVNKVLSKVTEPIVNKVTGALKAPSPTGSIRDWLKTNFVQDYKLSDGFVDMIDTELRRGKVQNDQVIDAINKNMSGSSPFQRDMIQYLISKDRVAFPEIHRMYMNEPEKFDAISKKFKLYNKANSMKNQIWANEDELMKFNMVGSDHAEELIKQRQQPNLFGGEPDYAYVNRQYKDREALSRGGGSADGRTIVDRRGMYDDDGNFIRSFTDAERKVMQPETEFVAEKSIANQLDKILQGRVMDRTLKMDDLIKTPEQMKKFAGKTPTEQQDGFTLLQGSEYGNLSGNYVQTQTAQRLKSMIDDVNAEPSLWNNYRKYVGQWKAAVTIKNPKTHINNMVGNAGMMATASDIPASKTASIISNGLKIHGEGISNQVYESARNIGLLERTKVQELAQMSGFDNAASKVATSDSKLMTGAKNAYLSEDSKMGKPIFDAYQKEDEVFKLGIYNHYYNDMGMTAKQARAATEKIVFDYAKKLPRGVEFLRNTGLIPFVTWSYRSLPMFAEALAKRPAHLATTATALALMNDGEDDAITQPTVGGRKLSTTNWTPYMEYLSPQEYLKNQTLSGIPQQAASLAAGQRLQYGRMRTLDKKGMTATDSLLGRVKGLYDLMPVPDVYNDLYDIAVDKRSVPDSAFHRLLITNSPKKSSRNRKRDTRKRN